MKPTYVKVFRSNLLVVAMIPIVIPTASAFADVENWKNELLQG